MLKKIICVLLTLALVLGAFAACGGKTEPPAATTAEKTEETDAPATEPKPEDTAKRYSIVTTIFPIYD